MTHPTSNFATPRLAKKIVSEAQEVGADRVVFRTKDQFIFSPPEHSSVADALKNSKVQKYKLQERENKQWVDIQPYRRLATGTKALDTRAINRLISEGRFESLTGVERSAITDAYAEDPTQYTAALRALHRKVFLELGSKRQSPLLYSSLPFFNNAVAKLHSPHTQYLRTLFDIYSVMEPKDLSMVRGMSDYSTFSNKIHEKAHSLIDSTVPAVRCAISNVLGKVSSLFDREIAAQHFHNMHDADEYGLIEHYYLDQASTTYFPTSALNHEKLLIEAERIQHNIQPVDVSSTANRLGVVMSVDPSFYRIYGPQIIFYAQQLPEIDFNIVLCGPIFKAEKVISDGQEYQRGLSTLNRGEAPSNLHHFHVATPEYVRDEDTFFASARFFAVELLLERYKYLYIMDADLTTDTDPRIFFNRISKLAFAAPEMNGFYALHPWRRYMAGNIAINRDVLKSNLLSDLQAYLVHGLHKSNSWTLDQNALTYAIERNSDIFQPLNEYNRPFYQNKFRLVWERSYPGDSM